MIFLEGLTLGLANNLFCVGTCVPVLLPVILAEKDKTTGAVFKFMAGRLAAYLFFGAVSGAAGIYFNGRVNPRIFSGLVAVLALVMIVFAVSGFKPGLCPARLSEALNKSMPFYIGIVMGINICPPFLLGLSKTIELGSIGLSVLFFLGFFVGSSVWLIPVLFTNRLPGSKYFPVAGRILAAIVGLWYLYRAATSLTL